MKIVNICMGAPFTEGYTYQDSMLSAYQHKIGHDVTVITGLRTRDESGKVVQVSPCDCVLSNGVRLIRIAPKGLGKIAKNVMGVYTDIPGVLEVLSPDVIMVHGLGTHAVAYAARYHQDHVNTHLIADNHQDHGNTNIHNILLNGITRYFKFRWKTWIKTFDKVYGVTSWRTNFAHDYYGIPNEKLDVLVLGIDDSFINFSDDVDNRKSVRDRFSIPQNSFLFCSGGKLDSNKKIIEMMQAFSRVKGENLRYIIFGSVSDDIEEEFNRDLENDKRIQYIGYIPSEDTNSVLAASDFGLFAGLHSVLWEQAVGCGLPCIFRRYSMHDHFNLNGNCIELEAFDVQTIQKEIEKVVRDRELYSAMKLVARSGAGKFAYSEIAKKSVECAEK